MCVLKVNGKADRRLSWNWEEVLVEDWERNWMGLTYVKEKGKDSHREQPKQKRNVSTYLRNFPRRHL